MEKRKKQGPFKELKEHWIKTEKETKKNGEVQEETKLHIKSEKYLMSFIDYHTNDK